MGRGRTGNGKYSGSNSNKLCECGHPKVEHTKRKGRCHMCTCIIFKKRKIEE